MNSMTATSHLANEINLLDHTMDCTLNYLSFEESKKLRGVCQSLKTTVSYRTNFYGHLLRKIIEQPDHPFDSICVFLKKNGYLVKVLTLNQLAPVFTDDQLECIIKYCSRLTCLHLEQKTITDKEIKSFKFLPKLRCLKLIKCKNVKYSSLKLLESLDALKFLSLMEDSITDRELNCLVQSFSQLESLELIKCQNITNHGLRHLLKFTNHKTLTGSELKHSPALKNLKVLNLSNCSQLTDDALERIQSLSHLTVLNLTGLNQITDQGMEYIKNLKKIKTLIIKNCSQITDKGFEQIKDLELDHLEMEGTQITSVGSNYLRKIKHLT